MARLSHFALVAATVVILLATGLEPVFAQPVTDINANKPAKVTWTPKRVVNDDLIPPEEPVHIDDVEMSTFAVTVSADKLVEGAQLWVSGSLAGVLDWPADPFDIPDGESVEIIFTLLQTPDEAGRTLGGTVHIRADERNLARPLTLSLKKTQTDEEEEVEDGIVDDEGNLPVSWSLPTEEPVQTDVVEEGEESDDELFRVTPDLFDEDGFAMVILTANRDLTDVLLWLTPSLRDCVAAYFPSDLESTGTLVFDDDDPDQRRIAFIAAGEDVPVVLELLKATEYLPEEGRSGTLHVRSFGTSHRTWPAVLGFSLGSDEEEPEVSPSAIVDGANFELGAIAPNQVVSIFGLGLGPDDLVDFQLKEDGSLPDDLSGVMVLFNGYIAPLLAAGRGQINAIVPGEVKGKYADLVVINKGKASGPFPVDVEKIVPRIFTAFGTGTGQAAAVNPKGVVNGVRAPASVGSVLSLWITGVGATVDPDYEPGVVAKDAAPLLYAIRVFVGGVEAEVIYAGAAPGMVGAVAQINIVIGEGTPSGPQPILIIVGDSEVPSPESITVEIE